MKHKNIPLFIMSLFFVGALAYGGFQIASAQKSEFLEHHSAESKFLSQSEKSADRGIITEKVAPRSSVDVLSRHDDSGYEDHIRSEGARRTEEKSGERNESPSSDRGRHDDDEDEDEDEGDEDESWTSRIQPTIVTTPVPAPTPVTPSVTPPTTTMTLAQVAQHGTANDCWMVIQGKVYNVSTYIRQHPGGSTIVSGCGVDATTMFNSKGSRGHSQGAWNLLPQFFVGNLGA